MLPPHELRSKGFTKAMRGYNPVEVDEYIEFLIDKYTELYRDNDELERKLKAALTRLDEMKNDEDTIRSTLLDAKHAANKIKADAEERAENIVKSAKASCNTILSDFNTKVEDGRAVIAELQRDAFALKRELFTRYSEHIAYIEKLTEGMDESAIPETDELHKKAMEAIKSEVAGMYKTEEEEPADIPESEKYDTVTPKNDDTDPNNSAGEEVLVVDREPLVSSKRHGLRDSVKELNQIYRDSADEIINTPDSDPVSDDDYLNFVRSVTGSTDDKKDADFDMLFDSTGKKKKRK